MFSAIYPLNCIILCIIFSLLFENGRTEESFECRSEFTPPGSTESVNITCCSNIEIGENDKIWWRKYDEALGTCIPTSSEAHDYTCYPSQTDHRDHYKFETCGPNCFAFGIVQLEETDLGEYYITLTEGYSVLLAKKLVLNLTLGSDIEHVATANSSSASTEATHSASSSMSCSYSDQSTTPSKQTALSHPYGNSSVTSTRTSYHTQTTYYKSENASVLDDERELTSSILNIKTHSSSANTTSSDTYLEVGASNILERNHSNVVTVEINPSKVERTHDSTNTSKLLLVMVTFALLFGLITCFYTIFTKVCHCEKKIKS